MAHKKNGWIRANDFLMFMVDGNAEKILHLQDFGSYCEVYAEDNARTIRASKVTPSSLQSRRYILLDDRGRYHDYLTGKVVKYGS